MNAQILRGPAIFVYITPVEFRPNYTIGMNRRRKNVSKRKRINRKTRKMRGGNTIEQTREIEVFIPKRISTPPTEIHGIPLVIYRTWNEKQIPIGMWKNIHKSLEMTPEFDHVFYDDTARLKSIEENFEPNVVKAYKCLKPGAFKADLWRYCILYVKGGIYIDMDIEIVVPLLPILKENSRIYIQQVIPERKHCVTSYPGVINGFLAFSPKNPVLRACIDEIVQNCKSQDYKVDFLDITGPCLLARKIADVEGSDKIISSPFKHKILKEFHYNDVLFLKEYEGKDSESALTDHKHYSQQVSERNVFDTSIHFD